MLAKDIKIRTLKMQREFIEDKLSQVADHTTDGDTSYPYIGYIYPEVISYFEANGFSVREIKSENLTAMYKGIPVHLFTVKDDIVLTEDEMKKAEEFSGKKPETDEDNSSSKHIPDNWDDIFSSIFNPDHE